MIKNFVICYWHLTNPKPECLEWESNTLVQCKDRKEYRKKLAETINKIEAADCNVMVLHNKEKETSTVFIDKGRFRQC